MTDVVIVDGVEVVVVSDTEQTIVETAEQGPPGIDGETIESAEVVGDALILHTNLGNTINVTGSILGPAGADGADGTDGSNGADGASAYQVALDDGFVGTEAEWLASLIGPAGADGVDGADGTNGTNGANGVDGSDGADGTDGNTVLYGTAAPTTEGVDGNFYLRTTTNFLYGPKAAGVWPAGISLVGPPGADGADGVDGVDGSNGTNGTNGADGRTILYGTAAPTTEGVDGDFYIRTTTNFIYGPKASGAWPAGTSLVGPAGTNGTNGTNGADGADGVGVPVGGTTGQLLAKNSATDYDTEWVDAPSGGGGSSVQNPIINGAFAINQRAPATNADDTYAHDRWYALTQTGTIAVTTLSDVENTTPTMARLSQSQASAQRMGYAQIIEGKNCKHLRGQQVTFRFGRTRLSSSANVRFAVLEWTGTEDTVTSDVVNDWTSGTYTAGNFFLTSNLTVSGVVQQSLTANTLTTGSSVTVTLGSSFNNLIVFAWTESTVAQNVTFDLGKAQIELGATASNFERRPYGVELSLCQRYYCRIEGTAANAAIATGMLTSTANAQYYATSPVPMRIPPTGIEASAVTTFEIATTILGTASAISHIPCTNTVLGFQLTSATTFTAGAAARARSTSGGGAYIGFTGAEL